MVWTPCSYGKKRLESGELVALAMMAMQVLREVAAERGGVRTTRLLVNGRPDIAAAAGADGVHLTAKTGELTPGQVRQVFLGAGLPSCFVSVSCHTVQEVAAGCQAGADLILFGPVFEKRVGTELVTAGLGLRHLSEACVLARRVPVLALGGVTEQNTPSCLAAGAAGIAGIRLFQ